MYSPRAVVSWETSSQQLGKYLLEQTGQATGYFTYQNFLCYLLRESAALDRDAFADTYAPIAQELISIAKGQVYLADGTAFVGASLAHEFPELELFHLPIGEAFIESQVHPGIFIETKRFADLHLLSRMRRELRQSGKSVAAHSVDVIKILLGLTS